MRHRVAFGTLPPTLAAAAQPGENQECVIGVIPPCPTPSGAPVMALTPRAAADPHGADFLTIHPALSACDIGILRGLFHKPEGR